MPFEKGNTLRKGQISNNVGRKSVISEEIKAAVVSKSWVILNNYFEQGQVTKEKRHVALEVAKKSMPTKIEGDIGLNEVAEALTQISDANKRFRKQRAEDKRAL